MQVNPGMTVYATMAPMAVDESALSVMSTVQVNTQSPQLLAEGPSLIPPSDLLPSLGPIHDWRGSVFDYEQAIISDPPPGPSLFPPPTSETALEHHLIEAVTRFLSRRSSLSPPSSSMVLDDGPRRSQSPPPTLADAYEFVVPPTSQTMNPPPLLTSHEMVPTEIEYDPPIAGQNEIAPSNESSMNPPLLPTSHEMVPTEMEYDPPITGQNEIAPSNELFPPPGPVANTSVLPDGFSTNPQTTPFRQNLPAFPSAAPPPLPTSHEMVPTEIEYDPPIAGQNEIAPSNESFMNPPLLPTSHEMVPTEMEYDPSIAGQNEIAPSNELFPPPGLVANTSVLPDGFSTNPQTTPFRQNLPAFPSAAQPSSEV